MKTFNLGRFVAGLLMFCMLFTLVASVDAQRLIRVPKSGDEVKEPVAEVKEETPAKLTSHACSTGGLMAFITSGNSSSSTWGNTRTYYFDGVTATVRGFSRRNDNGTWETAYLGQFGTAGLGVQDRYEGSTDPNHKVDSSGTTDNFVVIQFDQNVLLDTVQLRSVTDDSDLELWYGQSGPIASMSNSVLSGLTYELNTTGSNSSRDASFNSGALAANVLILAARTDQSNDWFKVAGAEFKCAPKPNIKIVKQVETIDNTDSSTQAFGFTSTNAVFNGSSSFSLTDDNAGPGVDNVTAAVTAGTQVAVTEGVTLGWTLLDISCDSGTWVLDFANRKVTVTAPASGQTVTCTFVNGQQNASAAKVNISGRAMFANSRGISGAVLTLWDANTGETRQATTNSFGSYQFSDVEVGKFYVVSISHPRYIFNQSTQSFSLEDSLTSLDFVY